MVKIELINISKSYGKIKALRNVSFEIKNEEYFLFLGPTGAGKTTLLKIIAGLVKPDFGTVMFDGIDVTNKPANERDLGYVFENYALFQHMDVLKNISYSGRVRNKNYTETKALADEILLMTLLTGRNHALPSELSGGMQQRLALSRALLSLEQTGLILLDEPLKALDAGLRMSLRTELKSMSKDLKLTSCHVTNDMEEAMMLADRIAVIDNGEIIQIGNPQDIYYHPNNLFVANFMSEINYFNAECMKHDFKDAIQKKKESYETELYDKILKNSAPVSLKIDDNHQFIGYVNESLCSAIKEKEKILLVCRSNHMKIRRGNRMGEKQNSMLGIIQRKKFMGVFYRFEIDVELNHSEKSLIVTIPATSEIHENFPEGMEVTVYFPEELGIAFKHPGDDEINSILKLE